MRQSVCAVTLFTDRPLADRFAALAELGVGSVELWGVAADEGPSIADALRASGMRLECFSGNRRHGLIDAADRPAFLNELRGNIALARSLGCPRLMLLAEPLDERGHALPATSAIAHDAKAASLRDGLAAAAGLAEGEGIDLLVEPLNSRVDHRGYWLDRSDRAFDAVRAAGSPRVRVLYDIYHMHVMGEDPIGVIAANLPWIGHFHVADAPGRHEPGTGAIPYRQIGRQLRRQGYAGGVGLECVPREDSRRAVRAFLDVMGEETEHGN
jgi:hydroxypyruvate isomerase